LETAVLPIRTTPLWCLTHKFYLHYPWEFSVISMESAVSQGRDAYYTQDNKRHKVFVNHVSGNTPVQVVLQLTVPFNSLSQ